MAAHSNQWATGSAAQMAPMPQQQQLQQQQQQGDGYGLQTRPMGCEQIPLFCLSALVHKMLIMLVPPQ
jgi:hypothetical protein